MKKSKVKTETKKTKKRLKPIHKLTKKIGKSSKKLAKIIPAKDMLRRKVLRSMLRIGKPDGDDLTRGWPLFAEPGANLP